MNLVLWGVYGRIMIRPYDRGSSHNLLYRPALAVQPIHDNHVVVAIAMSVTTAEAKVPVVHLGDHVAKAITKLDASIT